MLRKSWLLSLLSSSPLNPCCPTGQDIYSTIKKSQQNGKIPRFRRVRGGGELYTSDTVMQSEWGTFLLWGHSLLDSATPTGTPEAAEASGFPSPPVTALLLPQISTKVTSLSSGDGEMRVDGRKLGCAKCPSSIGQLPVLANPCQAETWAGTGCKGPCSTSLGFWWLPRGEMGDFQDKKRN